MLNTILIVFLLIILFYTAFIAYSDFSKFSNNIQSFNLMLLPIILILSASGMVIMSIRQKILLTQIGVLLSLKENILLYLSGLSLNVTPAGSGELIKSIILKKKHGYKTAKTLPLFFIEKLNDLISIITIIGFTLIFFQITEIMIGLIAFSGLTALIYGTFRVRRLFIKFSNLLKKIPYIKNRTESIEESYDSFYLMTSSKTTLKCWIVGLISWIIEAFAIYFVFLAFNTNLEFLFTTMVVFSSYILGAISLLPGGVGLTEISVMKFLTEEGMEISLVTSIIIMMRIVTIWFATIMGSIILRSFYLNNKHFSL